MEIRIILFLALTAIALVINAALLWFSYRQIAGSAEKVFQRVGEFQRDKATLQLLNSLLTRSEEIVSITETARQRFSSTDEWFATAEARYGYTLAKMDTKLERLEETICDGMSGLRSKVEGQASRIAAFAAGMRGVATAAADSRRRRELESNE
jgi:hypothetical protein